MLTPTGHALVSANLHTRSTLLCFLYLRAMLTDNLCFALIFNTDECAKVARDHPFHIFAKHV